MALMWPLRLKTESSAYIGTILKSNQFQLSFCLLTGLLCFLPIALDYESHLEDKPLRSSMTSINFSLSCIASVALVIPLAIDIFLDIIMMIVDSDGRKKGIPRPVESSRFHFLNICERSLILIGLIVLPIVIFLPKDTDNLALIYLCCYKCQQNWVGGACAVSLCRYNRKYWSTESTCISIFFFSLGLVGSTFTCNIYAGAIGKPSVIIVTMDLLAFFFTVIPALINILNCSRWLIIVYFKMTSWKQLLPWNETIEPPTAAAGGDHTFFPMVYTISAACLTILFAAINIAGKLRIENFSCSTLVQSNVPFFTFMIMISTLSMRMVKYEVVQGLVSNISLCSFFSIILVSSSIIFL